MSVYPVLVSYMVAIPTFDILFLFMVLNMGFILLLTVEPSTTKLAIIFSKLILFWVDLSGFVARVEPDIFPLMNLLHVDL